MKKTVVFFKTAMLCGIRSRNRFVLTVFGLMISAVFICTGLIYVESYYNGQMDKISKVPKDTIMISTYDSNVSDAIYHIVDGKVPTLLYHSDQPGSFKVVELDNATLYVDLFISGIEAGCATGLVYGDNSLHMSQINLIEGRMIDSDDVLNKSKVVVLDDIIARMIFGSESPLGKKVTLSQGCVCEVVGVVEANTYSKRNYDSVRRGNSYDGIMEYCSTIYVPNSTYVEYLYKEFEDEEGVYGEAMTLMWDGLNSSQLSDLQFQLERMENIYGYEYQINDYIIEYNEVVKNIINYKRIYTAVIAIVAVLSGINCLNITLFSIKERVKEIGIRKAYGATTTDILLQMLGEAILISVIASILGIIVSILISTCTMNFVGEVLEISFVMKISGSVILVSVIATILQSVIFSIFPCIYASKTEVVDALRFE